MCEDFLDIQYTTLVSLASRYFSEWYTGSVCQRSFVFFLYNASLFDKTSWTYSSTGTDTNYLLIRETDSVMKDGVIGSSLLSRHCRDPFPKFKFKNKL